MNSIPSDNILELRRLSAKLCEMNNDDYRDIIIEIKNIIENDSIEITKLRTPKEKIKCYEIMCANITNLLQKFK
jgi:hypothetical protein